MTPCFYCGAPGRVWWEPSQLVYRYGLECWKRRRSQPYFDHHIDHRRSVHRGGTKNLDNLVLACSVCNYDKGWKHDWPSPFFVEAT